jgi:hypothetical protein
MLGIDSLDMDKHGKAANQFMRNSTILHGGRKAMEHAIEFEDALLKQSIDDLPLRGFLGKEVSKYGRGYPVALLTFERTGPKAPLCVLRTQAHRAEGSVVRDLI